MKPTANRDILLCVRCCNEIQISNDCRPAFFTQDLNLVSKKPLLRLLHIVLRLLVRFLGFRL